MEKVSTSIIILIVLLFLLLIGSIIWIILAKSSLDDCRNTESIACPYYYCENNKNIGSPCVEILKQGDIAGPNVAFRQTIDKNGNTQIMCQKYASSYNVISSYGT
jgi:hypothetical protein